MTIVVLENHVDDSALRRALADAPWSEGGLTVVAPDDPAAGDAAAVLLSADRSLPENVVAQVVQRASGRPLLLLGQAVDALRDSELALRCGVAVGSASPVHEIRVRPRPALTERGAQQLLVRDRVYPVADVAGDVEVLATSNLAYTEHAVVTYRPSTRVGAFTLGSTPQAWSDRDLIRLLARWANLAGGVPRPADVRLGMLGYGAIGHEHAVATREVPGLALTAVADLDPGRVAAARTMAADLVAHASADALLADPDIDLVVVSTPPNSHAEWALRALDAGKHVILEKPMALSAKDCDAVLDRAAEVGRIALVYQNRRFDPDYQVLRRLADEGALGEVFHVESFVGGYGHPCNYWHSDVDVSGGALFDWGSHVLDQVLDLLPQDIAYVTSAEHKRVWHDVTNADHSRVTVRFDDGTEAEFVHSDLAAAVKPKWYVLGTRGAVVGQWRRERVIARGPIGTLDEDVLALADSPATMQLHHPDGSVTELAVPAGPAHPFHRDLADHLLEGMPMRVRPEQSRRVVAVLEAAAESAAAGGHPVVPA